MPIEFRRNNYNDQIDLSNVKISKLILSVYSAKKFAILNENKDKCWFLTGDAAMGVPYFRALNSGMMLSSRLSQILTKPMYKIGNEIHNHANFYNIHQPMHIQTEYAIAFGKNAVLESFNQLRKLPKKF